MPSGTTPQLAIDVLDARALARADPGPGSACVHPGVLCRSRCRTPGPAAAVWMVIGVVYLVVLMVKRPERIRETKRVFAEE